jgi:hypothetical protein
VKTKLDKYHYHEALDRCSLVAEVFEDQVIDHHVIHSLKKNHPAKKTANKISELFGELYQQLGTLSDEKHPSKKDEK